MIRGDFFVHILLWPPRGYDARRRPSAGETESRQRSESVLTFSIHLDSPSLVCLEPVRGPKSPRTPAQLPLFMRKLSCVSERTASIPWRRPDAAKAR
jgi:hypothetical protein